MYASPQLKKDIILTLTKYINLRGSVWMDG
jgi:hypothetical protein